MPVRRGGRTLGVLTVQNRATRRRTGPPRMHAERARDAAGLRPLRWHDLRHTWASWAVQSGVTLHELMLLGGWRSFSMVLRYAHLAPGHLALAAAKVRLRPRTKTGTLKKAPHENREKT